VPLFKINKSFFMNKVLTVVLSLMYCLNAFSQTDKEVLFTYGANNTPVTVKEFLTVYKKNNMGKEMDYKEASIREYLNLYEHFKVKVAEGKALKIDTLPQLKSELISYRKQLAKNYLVDKEMLERLYKEVYERSNIDIRVSHIVLKLAADAAPKDTLALYQKMQKIKTRLLTGKEDFALVAKETSDDPSVKNNGGDLGYITALQSFYNFENAAYNTPVGSLSGIFRTKIGYHLIKVTNKRASRGQVLVEHILVATAKSSSKDMLDLAQMKVNRFYSRLKSGKATFEELARDSSDDHASAQNGGKLPWFGAGKMVPEFEEAAFNLKEINDISMPIRSDYGYHIIRLVERKKQDEYAKSKDDIKRMVDKDIRFEEAKKAYLKQVKKENNFSENKSNYNAFTASLDSSLLKGTFKAVTFKPGSPIFSIGTKTATTTDFANYCETAQKGVNRKSVSNSAEVADRLYAAYLDKIVLDYAEDHLEAKYPDFKNLITEYSEGIVLFEITDRNVWSKAVNDSTGLKAFYQANTSKYQWLPRAVASTFKCTSDEGANFVKALVTADKNISNDSIRKRINTSQTPFAVTIEEGKFEKGQNPIVDECKQVTGIQTIFKDGFVYVINITNYLPVSTKTLEEARGYVIADYQEYLEKSWMSDLTKKYVIKENQVEFKKLVKP